MYSGNLVRFFILVLVFVFVVAVLAYQNKSEVLPGAATAGSFFQYIKGSGIDASQTYGGVAWTDYNGDGYMDLLMIRGSGEGLKLFRNNRDETFSDVTTKSGLDSIPAYANAAVFGDFNNDGCRDLYVAVGGPSETINADGASDRLFRNNCDGTFTDTTVRAGISDAYHSQGVAWGDYNNDGFLDAYIATYGRLEFTKSESAWELIGWVPEPNVLYRNNGDGTFEDVAEEAGVGGVAWCEEYAPYRDKPRNQIKKNKSAQKIPEGLSNNWQPVWFDYNNDGLSDIFVSNETALAVLYRNNGDGTFEDVTKETGLCQLHSTHGVAVGDYNNDGYLDLYLAGSVNNLLWRNNGDGTFSEVSEDAGVANFGFLGWGAGFIDYDNDGLLDIYAVNGTTQHASYKEVYPDRRDQLYKNKGDGTFAEVSGTEGIFGNDSKSSGAFADFNNDGFVDAFIISDVGIEPAGSNRLYTNTPNTHHWLTVKLEGRESNRDGVGAQVTVKTGGKQQIRYVMSGGSFRSQNSMWPTFGLGEFSTVDLLTIRWPSGAAQTLSNINANQTITVLEGVTADTPEYTVELGEGGFTPAELHISRGATVKFVTSKNKDFWPASNLHPQHDAYPDFDAQKPIAPSREWSFLFSKDGVYNYHDHLNPFDQGTIIVGKGDRKITGASAKEDCYTLSNKGEQSICWQFLLADILRKEGVGGGLNLLGEISETLPYSCHQLGHDFGEYAYRAYSEGSEEVQIGQKGSYCSFGFWHGFMTEMLRGKGFIGAREFCDTQNPSTPAMAATVMNNCYHGIGIGMIPDPPSQELWGKTQALIDPALDFCDTIPHDKFSIVPNCYSGVFHGVIDYMQIGKYGFAMETENPFALCWEQEKNTYREQCYYQMAPRLASVGDDLSEVFGWVQEIAHKENGDNLALVEHTLRLASVNFLSKRMSDDELLDFIGICVQRAGSFIRDTHNVCVYPVIKLLFRDGLPEREYIRAVNFCKRGELNDDEKGICFSHVASFSRSYYGPETVERVCDVIKELLLSVQKNAKTACG